MAEELNKVPGLSVVGTVGWRELVFADYGNVEVIDGGTSGVDLIFFLQQADKVIIIDAVCSGAKPGTLHRFNASPQPIPTKYFHCSTHTFGVAEAIELARALKQLPQYLIVYGIEGKCFETGVRLSEEVEKAAQEVLKRVRQDIITLHHGKAQNNTKNTNIL